MASPAEAAATAGEAADLLVQLLDGSSYFSTSLLQQAYRDALVRTHGQKPKEGNSADSAAILHTLLAAPSGYRLAAAMLSSLFASPAIEPATPGDDQKKAHASLVAGGLCSKLIAAFVRAVDELMHTPSVATAALAAAARATRRASETGVSGGAGAAPSTTTGHLRVGVAAGDDAAAGGEDLPALAGEPIAACGGVSLQELALCMSDVLAFFGDADIEYPEPGLERVIERFLAGVERVLPLCAPTAPSTVDVILCTRMWYRTFHTPGSLLQPLATPRFMATVVAALRDCAPEPKARVMRVIGNYMTNEACLDAFAAVGGYELLLHAACDPANSQAFLETMLFGLVNCSRIERHAALLAKAGACNWLIPSMHHDSKIVAVGSCAVLASLARFKETLPEVQRSDCLNDVVDILRGLSPLDPELRDELILDEDDIEMYASLMHADQLYGVRLTGIFSVAKDLQYACNVKTLGRPSLIAAIRSVAASSDAFLYMHAITALKALGLPLPVFREKRAQDSAAAALSVDQLDSWGIDQVCAWVGQQPFKGYASAFRDGLINGKVLQGLDDGDLQELGIASRIHRKVILSAIADLAAAADAAAAELDGGDASYQADEAGGVPTAASGAGAAPITFESALAATDGPQSLAPAGDPFMNAATAGASSADVAPHALRRHFAGTATAVAATTALRRGAAGHRNVSGAGGGGHATFAASALVRGLAAAVSAPEGPEALDVFISYRRKGGSVLAQLIKVSLKARGINVFLDVENLGSGTFDTALAENLSRARNVVLVLSEGCLDRCIDPATNTSDFVRKEIALSMKLKKNLVPVAASDFVWPEPEALPEDIRELGRFNAVPFVHSFGEYCIEKLIKALHL